MDALFDEAETLLLETSRRVTADLSAATVADLECFDSVRAWNALAELGFLGIRMPEDVGGGGATIVDAGIVVTSVAEGLLPVPYLGSVLAAELLLAAGAPPEILGRVAHGELRLAIGLTHDLSNVWGFESASIDGDVIGFDAANVDALLVVDPDSRALRAVNPTFSDRRFDLTRTIASGRADDVVDVGGLGGHLSIEAADRFLARALALLSTDLVGVMAGALAGAVAHANDRIQFGVSIGSFQALQHLAADQLISLEGARSLTEYAAWAVDHEEHDEALTAARSAKAYCSRSARNLCEAVVQMYGGMGFTWECMAHVSLKRALFDARVLGDYAHQIGHLGRARRRSAA
jgi:alkylation response protein AidB-like acyl-CoA dehydrogenase